MHTHYTCTSKQHRGALTIYAFICFAFVSVNCDVLCTGTLCTFEMESIPRSCLQAISHHDVVMLFEREEQPIKMSD